ncbi:MULTISPECIES: DUF1488 family protein [Bradyrhizobium]|jgi:hypothetical protein|uniref:DUF1488 family protein n=1 Tax=Bradyrhizobium TaxID=374 RepID=UPI0004AFAC3F|nr:DUF1488 family protein [Bradyrhizobium elkanii]MCS3520223.1 hypothetical protein [Bradyrhizobium elkanii]MCS4067878.1 hypothetical protein [Bradyrhizobium elkanii]MCS4083414.1 hypothetical protein [Bradyrhizobium elkanii]MCW2126959.1 hypothetical protein [Bradyrhizobium elkanii]MCW2173706.1 hypothetical protein [Bradyrhizobium elkanii]
MALARDPDGQYEVHRHGIYFVMYHDSAEVTCMIARRALNVMRVRFHPIPSAEELFLMRRSCIERAASDKFENRQSSVTGVVSLDRFDVDF